MNSTLAPPPKVPAPASTPAAVVGPVTPWLAALAIAAWFAGAAIAATAGVWLGLGCTAVLLGTVVSAREWRFLLHLLRPRRSAVLAGILVGLAMTLATRVLYSPLSSALPFVARDVAALYGQLGAKLHWGLFLVLLAVICGEEVVWRGLVQTVVIRQFGSVRAVLLTAGLYALAHAPVGSPVLVGTALGCGLVWGALRAITGGLVAPLVAHLLWDGMVLFVAPVAIQIPVPIPVPIPIP